MSIIQIEPQLNKMFRLIRHSFKPSLTTQIVFNNTNRKHNLPIPTPKKIEHKFFPNVFGLHLNQHILTAKTIQMTSQEYKFHQKNSPNYIVALVSKVLDFDPASPNQAQAQKQLHDFYDIATYCHVNYNKQNTVEMQKIFKVKIQSLKKIDIIKWNQENQNTKKEEEQGQQVKQTKQEPGTVHIQPSIHKKMNKKRNFPFKVLNQNQKLNAFQLTVKLIQQAPPLPTPSLQFKALYLIDLFKKSQMGFGSAFNFNFAQIGTILDQLAAMNINPNKPHIIQSYLELSDQQQKVDMLIQLFKKRNQMSQHYNNLENIAKKTIRNKKYYEYFTQVFKAAKSSLDGKKTKQLFLQKATKNFKKMNPPQNIKQIFEKEVQRYNEMDQNSMEAGIVKAYIEQLSKIPYDVKSDEVFDLEFAQKIMDEEHYGMKEVKDAILEIIAVGKLKKSLKGKIFCFIGGPGLGKTSFAKSVALALNRKFYNISLGGVTDSSVLKGHRRTYMGAYSGKIIQALKYCGTSNPVILLDQVDKMGSSYHGDPRSELLQILDPNQNNSFVDNYVDVAVDLSNVLFITSANYERNISKPLLDRMQKIYLTSYTKAEKIQIFNKHLLRRAIQKTGVKPEQFSLPPQVVDSLVQQYSQGEPGVRYLQKSALNLLQKVAYKMLTKQQEVPIKITKENLHGYLGNSYFRRKDHTKIGKGVAISLGGGDYGSRLTYIEAFKKSFVSRKDGNRRTLFTGSLGEVFKEAMNISYTFARNFLLQKHNNRYLYENEVHVHAPEGAFKKDGSTDSLTIVTSLVSLALSEKVKTGVAMTGQITLHGQILRTHSIKQKIMVANRQKINQIILPKQNEPDVQNLSKDITQGIKFHFISTFDEAFAVLFPDVKIKAKVQQSA